MRNEREERARPDDGLAEAVAEFRAALPDWWFSVGDCSVSADASCGPDRQWGDACLLTYPGFDGGFHADLTHPATMAEALRDVMQQGLAARTTTIRTMKGDVK